jgi:hypothetical protein
MTSEHVDFQLTPPHLHRRNATERAIRTFKNHFIAGLCTTNPDFPLHLWDRLLPQALITLNLLRCCCPLTHNFTVPLTTTTPRLLRPALVS